MISVSHYSTRELSTQQKVNTETSVYLRLQSVSGVLEYKFDKSQQLGQTDRKALLITIVCEII